MGIVGPLKLEGNVARGTFEVQVVDRKTAAARWLTVQAESREKAIEQVASLGELVGEARLVSVVPPGAVDASSDNLPSEAVAITFAWLGLLIGPLGIVGIVLGFRLKDQTGGRRGNHAVVVGIITTVLWLLYLTVAILLSILSSA